MNNSPLRRGLRRVLRWLAVLLLVILAAATASAWTAFGHRATGPRRARMQQSAQWHGGHFDNPQPLRNDLLGSVSEMFHASASVHPREPIATVNGNPQRFQTPPDSGLRVTWLGHSSVLIEIDGHRVITDPVFSDRTSPLSWVGPQRYYAPPLAFTELPAIDAVLISHDHYDHLDYRTIVAMKGWKTTFIVPLGVGAHLAYWGVPTAHIIELDWWERTTLGNLTVVCTPARHASGRTPFDKDATLWASYALIGTTRRAYYSGDTGLFPAMKQIGAQLGPFDVTMIEVGQYNRAWPDWHIGPEQAVTAHKWLRGRVLLPIHWALFSLAAHSWTEPMDRVLVQAAHDGQTVLFPRPGESVEPSAAPQSPRWWPTLPGKTAAQDPIVSTQLD